MSTACRRRHEHGGQHDSNNPDSIAAAASDLAQSQSAASRQHPTAMPPVGRRRGLFATQHRRIKSPSGLGKATEARLKALDNAYSAMSRPNRAKPENRLAAGWCMKPISAAWLPMARQGSNALAQNDANLAQIIAPTQDLVVAARQNKE